MASSTTKQSLEVGFKALFLAIVRHIPFIGRRFIWRQYNNYINSLSKEAFDNNIVDIIRMINYGGKSASEYKNSEAELEVMVKRWPRLVEYKDALLEWIRECRKDNGFKE